MAATHASPAHGNSGVTSASSISNSARRRTHGRERGQVCSPPHSRHSTQPITPMLNAEADTIHHEARLPTGSQGSG